MAGAEPAPPAVAGAGELLLSLPGTAGVAAGDPEHAASAHRARLVMAAAVVWRTVVWHTVKAGPLSLPGN